MVHDSFPKRGPLHAVATLSPFYFFFLLDCLTPSLMTTQFVYYVNIQIFIMALDFKASWRLFRYRWRIFQNRHSTRPHTIC